MRIILIFVCFLEFNNQFPESRANLGHTDFDGLNDLNVLFSYKVNKRSNELELVSYF